MVVAFQLQQQVRLVPVVGVVVAGIRLAMLVLVLLVASTVVVVEVVAVSQALPAWSLVLPGLLAMS
jgi:hypothetical protein